MSKARLYNTEAVILRKSDLGEADSIITLFTPHLGKIRAVARGSRRTKSRIGGHVEPLFHSQLLLARAKSLDIVSQSQTIDSFLPLRNDLWRTSSAIYVVDLVDRFTADGEENYPLFRLLVETLHWLCRARDADLVLRRFELRMLGHVGYQPELQQCLACRTVLSPASNYFSASGGGVICPQCSHRELILQPISVNALKVLRFLQSADQDAVDRLRLTPQLSLEVKDLLQRYSRYLLERDLSSRRWLDRVAGD